MKGSTKWSYSPYLPPLTKHGGIYVCRIAPSDNSVHIEWLGEQKSEYIVKYRIKDSNDEYKSIKINDCHVDIYDLETNSDYEFQVLSNDKYSRVRYFKAKDAVGTVVNYLHPDDDIYAFSGKSLCSPCIIRHPNGSLLASMDVFVANGPQNLELIFRSDDDGETWHYVSELYPCFWGRMFIHKDKLYMLSCSTEYGDLLIGRSDDCGKTFCTPTVLLRGSCKTQAPGVHKNPQPTINYKGRVYTTLEWGSWAIGTHAAMVGSFPEDADPLDASAWLFSEPTPYNPNWKGVATGNSPGTLEGTLAVFPDGKLYNVMRYQMHETKEKYGLALAYLVDDENPENPLVFDHAIKFPGNHAKFTIQYDDVSKNYYSIICRITDINVLSDRRLISLMKSPDCENWEVVCDIIDKRNENPLEVGFQYPDFFIEGDDIYMLCRSAMNNARNFHDANYSTFHKIKNFRNL